MNGNSNTSVGRYPQKKTLDEEEAVLKGSSRLLTFFFYLPTANVTWVKSMKSTDQSLVTFIEFKNNEFKIYMGLRLPLYEAIMARNIQVKNLMVS